VYVILKGGGEQIAILILLEIKSLAWDINPSAKKVSPTKLFWLYGCVFLKSLEMIMGVVMDCKMIGPAKKINIYVAACYLINDFWKLI